MFSAKPTFWKQLATTFHYLGTAPTAMAFSLQNHCLCRVRLSSRTSHARSTADVRKPDWDAVVEQFSSVLSLVAF